MLSVLTMKRLVSKMPMPPQLQEAAKRRLAKTKHKGKAKPNPKAPLGEGGRFAALEEKLGKKPGVHDPKALAAAIGRRKYGKKKFAQLGKK